MEKNAGSRKTEVGSWQSKEKLLLILKLIKEIITI
jgi:hypothetical protein